MITQQLNAMTRHAGIFQMQIFGVSTEMYNIVSAPYSHPETISSLEIYVRNKMENLLRKILCTQ